MVGVYFFILKGPLGPSSFEKVTLLYRAALVFDPVGRLSGVVRRDLDSLGRPAGPATPITALAGPRRIIPTSPTARASSAAPTTALTRGFWSPSGGALRENRLSHNIDILMSFILNSNFSSDGGTAIPEIHEARRSHESTHSPEP